MRERAPRLFRTDIQALRALAIGLVVINHLRPQALGGGYVGVDVFFVISGFLITGHLLGEYEREGRVRFAAFYARRIRRLLPAALLVLTVTAIGVWALLPVTRWSGNGLQIIASATYVENWALAALSVDYSAHNSAASAVQHYWSLSVEEQFYLVWPILIVVGILLASRWLRSPAARRGALGAALVVGAVSFVLSVWFTSAAPPQAYFTTFTRMWEFAAGALVALLPRAWSATIPRSAAAVLALAGYGGIAFAAFAYGPSTPYPSAAAVLPVLGTAAIILAGSTRSGSIPVISTVTGLRPVQWLGDVSYSLYLWHWPLIVLTPFVIRHPLSAWSQGAVLVLSLLLAHLTRRGIEMPAQRASWWRTPRRAFLGMGAMMVIVCGVAGALIVAGAPKADAGVTEGPSGACAGPSALVAGSGCDPSVPIVVPAVPSRDAYFNLAPQCAGLDDRLAMDDRKTTRECDFSGGKAGPRVWLVGDSHAEQWQAAIFPIAQAEGWRMTISSFPGCPPAVLPFTGFDNRWGPVDYERCRNWETHLSAQILEERPDMVITSMAGRQQLVDDGSGRDHDTVFSEGLRATWASWADRGIAVVPILDTPLNGRVRDADCAVLRAETPGDCAVDRAVALPPDPIAKAVAQPQQGVHPVDLRDRFCDDRLCYAGVGGIAVFYDADHVSASYAARLSPDLAAVLRRIPLPGRPAT